MLLAIAVQDCNVLLVSLCMMFSRLLIMAGFYEASMILFILVAFTVNVHSYDPYGKFHDDISRFFLFYIIDLVL